MVLPEIHKRRQQAAALFTKEQARCRPRTCHVTEQVGLACTRLRQDFLAAGMGVAGASALVTEGGAVMFIENESYITELVAEQLRQFENRIP